MVLDPRKRQKKLERKAAKRKEQVRTLARQNPTDMRERYRRAAAAAVLHSKVTEGLLENGSGYVLLSREIDYGQVAFAVFLVDVYCLGVKNAMWGIRSRGEVATLVEDLFRSHKGVNLKPEAARKLVEGAVEYARNLGFRPHEDYQVAKLIFGDLDKAACTEEFVYGHNGKLYFVAGPYDEPERCWSIIHTLNSRVGPQGHHFLMPVGEDSFMQPVDMADGTRVVRIG